MKSRQFVDAVLMLIGEISFSISHLYWVTIGIDSKDPTQNHITFGEYVEITCTFACFEVNDILKFLFFALDNNKTGLVEKVTSRLFNIHSSHHELRFTRRMK